LFRQRRIALDHRSDAGRRRRHDEQLPLPRHHCRRRAGGRGHGSIVAVVNHGDWRDVAARRARGLPPAQREGGAGLYRLVTGAGEDDLATALAGDADPDELATMVLALTAALGPPVWTRGGWRVETGRGASRGSGASRAEEVEELAREHYEADG